MDVGRYDSEASSLHVELKFDSCPLNIPACFFVRFPLILSLGMQRVWMNRWASACRHVNRRPQQLHHPDSMLGRLLVDVWQCLPLPPPPPPPRSIPATSPNTVVHEYGWQARIPGIINVPRGHINHITIKRPNARKKCRDAIAHGRSREDKQFLRGGTRGCSWSASCLEIWATAILLCSSVAVLTASDVSCDKAGCSYMHVRFILAEMLTGTHAQMQLT